jgi:large subunit ribosomal protein L24
VQEIHMTKFHIKKGDLVYVVSGDDRGMTGRVLTVHPRQGKAIVEKVNMITKHKRRQHQTRMQQTGGLITQEAPIALSKLMLVDPKTNRPTRVRIEVRPDGTKARVGKKTGNVIGS